MQTSKIDFNKTNINHSVFALLDYWVKYTTDEEHGGFYTVSSGNRIQKEADRSLIVTSRLLYAFSAAGNLKLSYKKAAERAYRYLKEKFLDIQYGGAYKEVSYRGEATSTDKEVYSISFLIYALAEYFKLTGDKECRNIAFQLFQNIESHAWDDEESGYFDLFTREWKMPTQCRRRGTSSAPDLKTLRSHMHMLEACTNLYSVYKNTQVKNRMIWLTKQICETFTDGETGKLYQFFSRNWKKIEAYENFGDELEVSWQILDCTNILANKAGLRKEAEKTAVILANHTLENGFDRECGGMYLEKDQRGTIRNKEWWAQAEAVNGYLSIYFITKEEKYLQAAYMCWQFIRTYLIMPEGDWRWCVSRTGSETLPEPKQGPRKCPYHNTRMLLRLKNAVESMEERKDKSNASG